MSDQEFDVYLTLLGRFLNLKPGQREEVADELRDHLEQRLDELTRDGMSRAEAIRLALDEFGDAASLAAHFSHLASRRKRRFLMRCTFGSIGLTAAAILITIAVWPGGDGNNIPARAVAQDESSDFGSAAGGFTQPPAGLPGGIGRSSSAATARGKAPSNEQIQRAAIEAKLNTPMEIVEFNDTPLQEALDFISEAAKVDVLVNETSLSEEGLDLTVPVNLVLKHSKVSTATALKLVLERAGDGALVFRIRDGLVYVDTELNSEEEMELQVYNCRDLIGEFSEVILRSSERPQPAGMSGGGGGFFSVAGSMEVAMQSGGFGGSAGENSGYGAGASMGMDEGMGGGGMSGMSSGRQRTATVAVHAAAETLVDVVKRSTSGVWLDEDGQGGSIKAFNGLLVIQQTQKVHQEIDQLLEMMRAAEQTSAKPKRNTGSSGQRRTGGSGYPGASSANGASGFGSEGYEDEGSGGGEDGFGPGPGVRRTPSTSRKPPKTGR